MKFADKRVAGGYKLVFGVYGSLFLLALVGAASAGSNGHGNGHGKKPLVSSKEFQSTVSSRKLLKHAQQLVSFSQIDGSNTRAFGTVGHNATVNYIKSRLDKTGYYDTFLDTFPYLYSEGTAAITIDGTSFDSAWFTYGPGGDVSGPLVAVNNLGCDATDFPAGVAGNIAIIKRGTCTFSDKIALAGAAGAAGAIIYNNADGSIGGGTLGDITNPLGPYVPAGSLTGEDGTALVAALAAGETIVVDLHVEATIETRWTSNVIATSKSGDKNNIIFSGGHTDSVPAGPGINDNGSGSMGILELALQLPNFSIKNAVRFGFWTAEEFGLVGAEHYVTNLSEEERAKIALYLNFDMIASPNFGYFIYDGDGSAFNITGPAGSDHIEKTFEEFFAARKLISAPTEFSGRSDYGPFLDVGIPSGGLFTGAEVLKTEEEATWWGGEAGIAYDKCYHQACDGLANLHITSWYENTRAAAHAIATYATSLNGIPRSKKRSLQSRVPLSHDRRRHQACGHEVLTL